MSYWDIGQFLAEEEKVEFSLQHDAYEMDFLDASKEGVIPAGQTLQAPIWLVSTLYDYLELGDTQADMMRVNIPEDYHVRSLDRINSFRNSHRSSIEQVRTKADIPYFYETFEAMKKITSHEGGRMQGERVAEILEERGKKIIGRAGSAYEEEKADAITNNYTRFEMELYKLAKKLTIQYDKWRAS